ncbi:hypothetical protein TL16_g10142 [Triparma laevis f. inornata]|uniref:Uncharacterized protein n=2 Tax=Triparma laevis TaxID=1534972 RepID=A0A9W6ZWK9_9STRA|nr:hypothetical protein TrLO_g7555 [Triparma laevis f. longispina]GMH85170.1 hypothetical protein TL16_g10142 [Triparma laevis f. inornata]
MPILSAHLISTLSVTLLHLTSIYIAVSQLSDPTNNIALEKADTGISFFGNQFFYALLSIIILILLIYRMYYHSSRDMSFDQPSLPSSWLLISALSIYMTLTIRLLKPPSLLPLPNEPIPPSDYYYQGVIAWDFGPKEFPVFEDESTDPETIRPWNMANFTGNRAFKFEPNSFVHFAWGFIAIFFYIPILFPPSSSLRLCCDLVGSCMFPFYPSYNVVKRLSKKSDTLVASSLCNNGLEWAAGAVLGNLVGVLLVLVKDHKFLKQLEKGEEDPAARLTSSGVRRFSLTQPPPSKLIDFALSVISNTPRQLISFFRIVPWMTACALQTVSFAIVYLYTYYWEGSTMEDFLALLGMWVVVLWGVIHFSKVFLGHSEPRDDDWRRLGNHEEDGEHIL